LVVVSATLRAKQCRVAGVARTPTHQPPHTTPSQPLLAPPARRAPLSSTIDRFCRRCVRALLRMSCLACAAGVGGCQAGAASYKKKNPFDFPPHTATDNWADRHTFAPCLCAPLRVCAAHAEACICATISSCASCSADLPARTPRHANQVRVGVLLWALVDP
jgi:hypothetical protein